MDLQALKDELRGRQDCAAAIAVKDCTALAQIVSAGRTTTRLVPIADIQAYLQGAGVWWSIKAVPVDNPAHAAAQAILDVSNARYQNIDMTLPLVGQMFGALVLTGVIQQSHFDAITAMSQMPDPVSPRDVAIALWNDDGSDK